MCAQYWCGVGETTTRSASYANDRSCVDVDREADLGLHDTGIGRDDAEVEVRDAVIRAVETERLARDPELERREAVLDDAGDGLHADLLCGAHP